MVNLENRLVRYFLPPVVALGSLILGRSLHAFTFPFGKAEWVQLTALVIAAGFVVNVCAFVCTDILYRLLGTDWETVIPVNDVLQKAIGKAWFGQAVETPRGRDGAFYPFLVYHHVFLRDKAPELYTWSVRQFNSAVVAQNTIVGLLLTVGVVLILHARGLSGQGPESTTGFLLWIEGNALVVVILSYYLLFTRRRRRNLLLFLTRQ